MLERYLVWWAGVADSINCGLDALLALEQNLDDDTTSNGLLVKTTSEAENDEQCKPLVIEFRSIKAI